MYLALVEYKRVHGDCNVPRGYPDNPQLSIWVGRQRTFKKKGTLNPTRIQKLESEGFSWDLLEDAWHEMYLALVEYKRVHGDCNVPKRSSDNPQLGSWVGGQRQAKKQDKLSSERIQKLEAIGFQWTLIKSH